MTRIYSEKFAKTFFNTENNLILTSPYKNNNLFIILTLNEDKTTSEIFKYIFDPIEPEIRFCISIQKNQEIQSALHLLIHIEFILPGRAKNELILVSKNGDIWNAFEQNNSIKLSERIGKIDFNQIEDNSLNFFDIYDPIDIVAYFTKKTRDFACLVVKEMDRFYLLLNTKLFSSVKNENSILEFENSTVLWNSIAENLDLFSFNDTLGLAHISFPRNKINKEVPISIINLKKFVGNPKDICCINETLYIVTENHLHIYPNFKRYKILKSLNLPFSPELIWFEPQYKRCKVVYEGEKLGDFIISAMLTEISTSVIPIECSEKIKIYEDSKIKSIGNRQFGVIYGDSSRYIWVKREHISILKTHSLLLSKLKNPIPNALESLQRLKDLKLFDFDQMTARAEAGLPKSLLQVKRRIRRVFTKEEDILLIEHAYTDLSYSEIGQKLNRIPVTIYTHLKMNFGAPVCDKHNTYQKSCKECTHTRTNWVDECKRLIEIKKYHKSTYDERGEKIEFDFEEWVRKDKKRKLKKSSSFFSKILPTQMYDDILDFIINTDLLKGRSVNTIFEQCIQIFIDDYLRDSIIKGKLVPNHLLEIYFKIQKNMKILKILIPPYRKLVNKKYRPIGDFNFFFKDLMNLRKLYSPDICDMIRPYLLNIYKKLSKFVIRDGNLAAALYVISKKINKRFTQAELAEIFLITEVTLRSRVKEIKELMNQEILEPISEISRIVAENKTIIESIEEEKYQLKIFNRTIKDFIYKQEYQKIPQLITEIKINHLDENLSVISESLELASRIQDDLIVSVLIDFLIEFDYFDERIFNNLIRYLGSEDDSIISKILKLIYHYKPNLESVDVYEITETLTTEQNKIILKYINVSPFRIKKHNSLKEHIQNIFKLFPAD